MQNPPTIRIGGQVSQEPLPVLDSSGGQDAPLPATRPATLLKRLATVPGLQDLTSDLE
jgi:hypothetical protein